MSGDSDASPSPFGASASEISLRRIAAALGIPLERFFADLATTCTPGELGDPDAEPVLDQVRGYLRAADPEERRRFVDAVRSMAGAIKG